jgi:hypothetical protein
MFSENMSPVKLLRSIMHKRYSIFSKSMASIQRFVNGRETESIEGEDNIECPIFF